MSLIIWKRGLAISLLSAFLSLSAASLVFAQTTDAHNVDPKLNKIPEVTQSKTETPPNPVQVACNKQVSQYGQAAQTACCSKPGAWNLSACEQAIEKAVEKKAAESTAGGQTTAISRNFTGKAQEVYDLVKSCLANTSNQSSCIANAQPIKDELIKTKNNCLNQNAGNKGGGAAGNCSVCKDYYKAAVSNGSVDIFSASCGGSCVQINSGGNAACESAFEQSYSQISSAEQAAVSDWQAARNAKAATAKAKETAMNKAKTEAKNAASGLQQALKSIEAEENKKLTDAQTSINQPAQEIKPTRFKLIDTFYGLINPIKNFFKTIFRLGR